MERVAALTSFIRDSVQQGFKTIEMLAPEGSIEIHPRGSHGFALFRESFRGTEA
jgi:hypothetical protein